MCTDNQFDNRYFFELIAKRKIEEAMKYAENHVPDYLYKYYSLSTGDDELDIKKLNTLRNNQNWFDLSKNQNDPLDMKMACVDRTKSSCVSKQHLESVEELLRRLSESHTLCSFTATDAFNLPMWSFYANNHKGYCVKYKINNKKPMCRIMYEPNRIPLLSVPLNYMAAVGSKKCGKDAEMYSYIMFLLLNVKHDSWKQEKEYRLIYPTDEKQGQNLGNSMVGIEPVCVYIGFKCNEAHKKQIKDICDNNLKCACLQASISEDKILDFKRI